VVDTGCQHLIGAVAGITNYTWPIHLTVWLTCSMIDSCIAGQAPECEPEVVVPFLIQPWKSFCIVYRVTKPGFY
jgi:hypothetical protein